MGDMGATSGSSPRSSSSSSPPTKQNKSDPRIGDPGVLVIHDTESWPPVGPTRFCKSMPVIQQARGVAKSPVGNRACSIGVKQFLQREDKERKMKQAEEIKKQLFHHPDECKEMENILDWELELAVIELEESLAKIPKGEWVDKNRKEINRALSGKEQSLGPVGPGKVEESHVAIHNHSFRPARKNRWVWVTKTSAPDENGEIGFPASIEEIRRFGHRARKIQLNQPPKILDKSFVEAVKMGKEEERFQRNWKRRAEEDWQGQDGYWEEESINIPTSKTANTKATGIISVTKGDATEEKLDRELKNLIDEKWDWQVRKIGEGEYMAVFPNKNSLDTFSKISELVLCLYGLKVTISKSNVDAEATAILQTTWVKIYGIPPMAKDVGIVSEIATLAGEPLVVDELSLVRAGPVRVKMNCRDPSKLRGFVEIFFNSVGHEVRFLSEDYKSKSNHPPPPPSNKDYMEEDDDEADDLDEEEDTNISKEHKKKEKPVAQGSGKSGQGSSGGQKRKVLLENPPYMNFEIPTITVQTNEVSTESDADKQRSSQEVDSQVSLVEETPTSAKLEKKWDGTTESKQVGIKDTEPTIPEIAETTVGKDKGAVDKHIETVMINPQEIINLVTGKGDKDKGVATSALSKERAKKKAIENILGEKEPTETEIPTGYYMVHNVEGPYLMEKDKWPMLKCDNMEGNDRNLQEETKVEHKEADQEATTELISSPMDMHNLQEEGVIENSTLVHQTGELQNDPIEVLDNASNGDLDEQITMDTDDQGWSEVTSQKKKNKGNYKEKKGPMVATRQSARIRGLGTGTVEEKATRRAKIKNLEDQGTTSTFLKSFAILNCVEDTYLESVANDIGIEFEENSEGELNQISAIKAEELARATLAEAGYKAHLEKLKEKEQLDESHMDDLNLTVIDNEKREDAPTIDQNTGKGPGVMEDQQGEGKSEITFLKRI
ncbi:hypothetical protein EJB05_25840, partial [Eragrostis curvula]